MVGKLETRAKTPAKTWAENAKVRAASRMTPAKPFSFKGLGLM
ncbi:hypothetical protein [Rhodovulum visakhapatnamense]|nr:hypothetical protein [Rhodovulum visakhapatnamense]